VVKFYLVLEKPENLTVRYMVDQRNCDYDMMLFGTFENVMVPVMLKLS